MKLVALTVVLGLLSLGLFLGHKYRKQASTRKALEAGLATYNARQYTAAAANLGKYLTVNRQNVDVLYKYAESQLYQRPQAKGSLKQAASALEAVCRIETNNAKASELLAQVYLSVDDPDNAERVARAWQQASPDDARAGQTLATALITRGKVDEAKTVLQALLKKHPQQVQAAISLAVVLLQQKQNAFDEANKIVDAAVAADPQSPAALLARARFKLATGQYKPAREDVEAAEKLNPSDVKSCLDLGILLTETGLSQRATTVFDRAEKMAPADPQVYLTRGQVAIDSGDASAGAALVDRLLAAPLGERRFDLLPMACELYIAAHRTSDARKLLQQLRQDEASSEVVACNEAAITMAEGQTYQAIQQLEQVVRRAPKYARAYLFLSRAQARAQDLGRAADCCRKYLELVGTSPASLNEQLELTNLYARLGRWADAARVAVDAERVGPYKPRAVLVSIETQGYAARPKGVKPDPAMIQRLHERVKQLVAAIPDNPGLQILFGRFTAWAGRQQEAEQLLESIAQKPASRVSALLALVEIEEEAGLFDQAITHCKSAIESSNKDQVAEVKVRLIELHLAKGDAATSEKLAEELVSADMGQAGSQNRIRVAQMFLRKNQRDKARAILVRAIQEDLKDVPARLLLLHLQSAADQNPSRQDIVDQLRQIQGDGTERLHVWQAQIWLDREDWQKNRPQIESLLKQVLETNPVSQDAAFGMGLLYEKAEETDQALAMFGRAFDANTSDLAVATHYLAAASRAQHWAAVDHVLDVLPADDAMLQEYRIARAFRRGDTQQAEQMLRAKAEADPGDSSSRLQLAHIRLLRNETTEAMKLLEDAARIAPDSPEVLTARVQLHLGRSEWDQAIALCNQALAKGAVPQALALRASANADSGHFAEAEADLRRITEIKGWEERGLVAIGQLYACHGETEKAIEKWRAALLILPKSISIRREVATALLAGNHQQQEEALKLLSDLLSEKPGDESLLMLRADTIARTNPAEAARLYEQVIQRNPAAATAYWRLSQIALDRGQRDKALEFLEQGLAKTPADLELLLMKSQLLHLHNADRAIATASQAAGIARSMLNAKPNNQSLALALARAEALSGNRQNAIAALNNSLARPDPAQGVELRLALANLRLQAKEYQQADELIEQAARVAPGDPRPVELRILSLGSQGKWIEIDRIVNDYLKDHADDYGVPFAAVLQLLSCPEAQHRQNVIPLCERILKRLPDDADALKALGLAYYNLGRIPEAKAAFERGVRSHPTNASLVNNLCWLLCEHDQNPEEAERLAATVLTSGSAKSDYYTQLDTWGVIQYRLGVKAKQAGHGEDARHRFTESRSRLEECLRHPDADAGTKAQATLHLARSFSELDSLKGYELLKELLATEERAKLLSPEERKESEVLLQRLTPQVPAKQHAGL